MFSGRKARIQVKRSLFCKKVPRACPWVSTAMSTNRSNREHRPLVSTIIPVKDGERFLASAINSVLAQDYENFEIVVLDGKSTDNTKQIATSFQRVRYILQRGEGFGNALNAGIAAARGDLIAFISSDDVWLPNKLGLQVAYLNLHREVQYTITRVKYFLEEGDAMPPGFRKKLLVGVHPGYMPESLVARKSLFDWIGRFSADMKISADVDWFARAKDEHIAMAIIPEVLVHKRVHNANSTLDASKAQVMNHELLRSLRNSVARQKGGRHT
jgi:glycosyltransferase involved in cell wall biosynthesis